MYSTKEKNKIYNDLKNEDYGEADLLLLRKAWPGHQLVKKATRDPRRYAHEVLYALLGKVTRNDIRCNRREYSQLKEKENETLNSTGGGHADTGGSMADQGGSMDDNLGNDSQPGPGTEGETETAIGTTGSQADASDKGEKPVDTAIVEKLQEEIAQKDQELEQAEEQIDEAESEKEELQEELDAEREARQEAEAALEEEKKSPPTTQEPAETPKPPAKKSRKKTSTPTSTGETLPTETSNSPH